MSQSSFSKDTFLYSVMFWGQKVATVLIAPIAIAYFNPRDFGYMSLAQMVASFLYILGMLAVADQGLPRFFMDAKDEEEKKEYVATTFFITILGNAVIVLILFSITPLLPLIFKDIDSPLIFSSLVAILCLTQTFFYLGNTLLRWTFQSLLVLKINLSKTVLSAFVTIAGIIFLGWRAKETLLTTAIVTLGAGIWANAAIRKYINFSRVSRIKIKELLLFSWPLLGVNIFAFFSLSLNSFFLIRLTDLHYFGIFSVAYLVASLFETATSGFFWATGPYILSTYKEEWAPKKYAEYFSVISIFGICSIIILGLWGAPIVKIFRPDGAYQDIGVFIPWILAGTLLYYLGSYFSPGPYIKKETYWNLIAFLISSILNALLSLILIPKYGILGAGIAVTFSSLLSAIFILTISARLYFVPNRWLRSFSIILLTTALVSWMQTESCGWNINLYPTTGRLMITGILLLIVICPFYKDISRLGLFKKNKFLFSQRN